MRYACKILVLTIVVFLCNVNAFAQKRNKHIIPADTTLIKINARPIARKIEKPKPLIKELGIGIVLSNNGTSLSFRKYKADDELLKSAGFYVNVGQIKSPKEVLVKGVGSQDPNQPISTFVFSKINNLINIQCGYSHRQAITGILDSKNVLIHAFGDAGLNIGLLKPYYLSIARFNGGGQFYASSEKYNDTNSVIFLDKRYVYSKAPFFTGFGESKLQIGANLKAGLQFEYIPQKYMGTIVELGVKADVFATAHQILVTQKAQQIYLGAFVGIRYCIKTS